MLFCFLWKTKHKVSGQIYIRKISKYFPGYIRCKFGELSSFDHNNVEISDIQTIKEINEKLNKLSKAIEDKDKLIAELLEKLNTIEKHLHSEK